ncbi:MAG TPA: aminoacyl-tRNA hydrolase [Anaerolineaceae bacterium]
MEEDSSLIVGLGNPGREYRNNRHNAGFLAIDRLSGELGIKISRVQSKALIGSGTYEGRKVYLAKPQTYMNLSGQSVGGLLHYFKLNPDHLVVIHDDIDLPFGTIRIRPGGGAGGQKGVASIIQQLGGQAFARIRIGIGRPPGRMEAADYVLEDFTEQEKQILASVMDRVAAAVRTYLVDGLDKAMNLFNGSVTKE